MNTDSRVDAYIAKAPSFAQPILSEVRARIRKACPAAEETIKWNVPFYVLGGKLLASMAAFKKHAKVGVWTGMNPVFVDVTRVADLPPAKPFAQSLQNAAQHIGHVTQAPASKPATKKTVVKKTAAKKTAAKKTAAAKKTVAKNAAAKKTVAKNAAAKKTAAKKAVVKKAVVKKTAAKTTRKSARARRG